MGNIPLDDRALMETSDSSRSQTVNAKRSIRLGCKPPRLCWALCLLVYVIRKVGVQPIFSALGRVGFGFFLVVAINGLRHVLRTVAMSLSVPPEHRRFSFLQAFAARLGGESMASSLSPALCWGKPRR